MSEYKRLTTNEPQSNVETMLNYARCKDKEVFIYDELKKKIAQIIAKHLCPNKKSHFYLYGNSADCYNRDNFAECMPICDTVDALIAAGIGDVKAAEHRAEVAERALELCETAYILALNGKQHEGISQQAIVSDLGVHKFFIEQAEKELSEEQI